MAKILFVSTWGSHCGIATYTERLALNLAKLGNKVAVLAPEESETGIRPVPAEVPYRIGWTREGSFAHGLEAFASKFDIVHFQHEYGLFRAPALFLEALQICKRQGAKVVVTLHTIFISREHERFYGFLNQVADLVIVHTLAAAATLSAVGGQAQIVTITHGTPEPIGTATKLEGREFLKVPKDGVCILAFGFMSPSKNHMQTLNGFLEANYIGLRPKAFLVLCGQPRGNDQYTTELSNAIEWRFAQDIVYLRSGFVVDKDMPKVFATADFAILNTQNFDVYSASGQTHEHIAYGVPLVVVNAPIYSDALQAGALVFQPDLESKERPTHTLVTAIRGMVASPALRAAVGARMVEYAARTPWAGAAVKHDEQYRKLLEGN